MDYKQELELRSNLVSDDENKFVMAGAGAGKTFSLVKRIFNQIKKGESPSSIVAISFTNKSAEDLREKIIKSLDLSKMKAKDYQELTDLEKKNIEDAIKTIDEMHISTIHKFCGNILRENSIYSNVSPDFEIMEDKDDLSRKEGFINAYIRKLDFNTLELGRLLHRSNYDINKDIKKLYNILNGHIDLLPKEAIFNDSYYEITDKTYPYVESLIKKIRVVFDSIVKVINKYANLIYGIAKDDYNIEKIVSKAPNYYVEKLNKRNIDFAFNKVLYDEIDEKFSPFNERLYAKKQVTDMQKELKNNPNATAEDINRVNVYKERVDKYFAYIKDYKEENLENVTNYINLLVDIYKIYKNYILNLAYDAYKSYLDYLDKDYIFVSNDQLLVLTNRLLDNKDVCEKLKSKYKHIYIDEYQDTDHIQRDIALKLTKVNSDFIDNSIFLVGDPKQSIYRFRGAEPEVYFDTKKLFNKPNTKCYDLNINFRSNSKILEYVNNTFKNIEMTKDIYQDMLVRKANEISDLDYENSENLIGFYRFNSSDPKDVTNLIKHLKLHYKIRKEIGKDNDDEPIFEYQNIDYKDIMVQMPGHSKMSKFVKVFTDNKIPSKVAGESNFKTNYQIRAFVNLFEAFNNRGVKAIEEAYEVFKVLYSSKYINKSEKEAKEISENIYNMFLDKISGMNSYAIAIYLIEHLEYLMKEKEELEAFEINSIISKLYQIVEAVFSKDYYNGSKMSIEIRKYVMESVDYESLIDSDADAVSIINVHKAKGLEAPIVIFACVGSKPPSDAVYYNNTLYLKNSISNDEVIKKEIEAEDARELARLEYVAATRPKEAFIFAIDKSSYMFKFDGKTDRYGIGKLREITIDEIVDDNDDESYINYTDKDNSIKIFNPSLTITSPSSLENTISNKRNRLRLDAINKKVDIKPIRPSGNVLGTILHRAFELLVLNERLVEKMSKDEIIEFVIKEREDSIKTNIIEYKKFITVCLNELDSYFRKNSIYSTMLLPEFPFSCKLDDGLVSNGSIDLLSLVDENAIIYDYKSDEAEYIINDKDFEDTLEEKYSIQLSEYEKVIRIIEPRIKKISKKIIYFRRYDKENETIELKVFDLDD